MASLPGVLGGASQALVGILSSKTKVQFIQNNSTVIQLDASVSETHTSVVDPSEFPVENGQVISDFLINKPPELEITGIISDYPIGGVQGLLTEAATALTANLLPPAGLTALSAAVGLITGGGTSPSVAAYLKLIKLQKSGQPVDVLTSLFRYSNMWLTSISVPRDAQNGRILLFTAKFRQLLIVQSQSVNVSIFANPGLAAGNADTGNQSTAASAYALGQKSFNGLVGGNSVGGH